ncbi:OLC1v1020522C1 [Oldenlandia corymbosa var. corymbosa]|uniref:OLC1v1020522C1 n=1 Tax=Oldenlandia corymbosa var. corymbosa TaxID=529605 RepID=A0AAV1EGM3_OLDCO|nr:OLC1v1020522C1 [Oldenlandia corymbosa var. corymbosa]
MCPTGSVIGREKGRNSNLRSAFDVLDADHDGKISRDDLRTFYGGYFGGTSSQNDYDDVIGTMIFVADANRDGFVEYDEFEKVLGGGGGERPGKKVNGGRSGKDSLMEDVFKVMDKDGDGIVGHEDLKDYLTWAGLAVNDEDIKAMIKLGGGGDGRGVSYEGLLKVLSV